MTVSKSKLILVIGTISGLVTTLILLTFFDSSEVLIESLESRTIDDMPFFNRISYEHGFKKDVWRMRQSHAGLVLPDSSEWDELTIVVDKTKSPYSVRYQQFKNGSEVEYRVACFTCHSNGPRAIRPNWQSEKASVNFLGQARIALLNLRIKMYGPLETLPESLLNGGERKVPLMYLGDYDRRVLPIKTCQKCHNQEHWPGRGDLLQQHAGTIEFLVRENVMPAWPHTLTDVEKSQLKKFLQGR